MRRKVLCIVSLVAYLLLFCTCLAPSVEREMTLLADVKQLKANTMTNTNLPGYAVRWDDVEGLFHIVEGTGWNTGMRVEEIPRQYYIVSDGHIILHPGTPYSLIVSASRTPREGNRVKPVEAKERPGEKLIVYCPQGITVMGALQNNFTVVQQGEKGILLDTMGIKMPFFEHRIAESLKDRITAENMRVYSYTDAKQFLQTLPLVAILLGMLLLGIFLWGCGCLFSRKHRAAPWVNTGLCVLILLSIPWVAGTIDLPASLMPANSILDLDHYFREFSNIFTVLEQLGDTALQALRTQMLLVCAGIIAAFALLAAVLAIIQRKLYRRA